MSTPSLRGVLRIERVLGVDERRHAAGLLGVGDRVQGHRGLAGRLRTVDLDDAAAGQPADAEGDVERGGSGGDDVDGCAAALAQSHDRALAVGPMDLGDGVVERLVAVGLVADGDLATVDVAGRNCVRLRARRSWTGSWEASGDPFSRWWPVVFDAKRTHRHSWASSTRLWRTSLVHVNLCTTLVRTDVRWQRDTPRRVAASCLSARRAAARASGARPARRLGRLTSVSASRRCGRRGRADLRVGPDAGRSRCRDGGRFVPRTRCGARAEPSGRRDGDVGAIGGDARPSEFGALFDRQQCADVEQEPATAGRRGRRRVRRAARSWAPSGHARPRRCSRGSPGRGRRRRAA